MDLDNIKKHWEKLAQEYGTDLKATTKTGTIKRLEIAALASALEKLGKSHKISSLLEVGCGNGPNCFALAKIFPSCHLDGVDYVPKMVENAMKIKSSGGYANTDFHAGNVLDLAASKGLKKRYDAVFTDRCLINLNTFELQLKALRQLSEKARPGGFLLLIENSAESYGNQNACRESVGLAKRTPDPYNLFINDAAFLAFATGKLGLKLLETCDFGSLHDLVLYVMLPKMNGGKVDYSHPLVEIATEISLAALQKSASPFGAWGQNRLYVFQKPEGGL